MADNTVMEKLATLAPMVRAAGVTALYLFGSTARGDERTDSDIDLLFDAPLESDFSLLDQARLQHMLSVSLGRPVDFIERRGMRHRVMKTASSDLLRIF